MKEVNSKKSALHRSVAELTSQCFPEEKLVQEHPIRIDGKTLFFDIFIPRLKIAIECDGEQHFGFNKRFHKDASSFINQKKNDTLKETYCSLKNITLVRIKYNDKLTKEFVYQKIIEGLKG